MTASLFAVTICPLPAVLRDVEDHAVGILELALEIAVALVAEIEKELAAVRFDALLRLDEIVDLKAEMVGADEGFWILQVGGLAAGAGREIEQRQIDHAVAHVDGRADVEVLARDAFELEHVLVKLRRLLQVLDADGEMAQSGHEILRNTHERDWTVS